MGGRVSSVVRHVESALPCPVDSLRFRGGSGSAVRRGADGGIGHEGDAAGSKEDIEGDEAEVLYYGGLARRPGDAVVAGAALLLDLHDADVGAVTAKAAVLGPAVAGGRVCGGPG